MSRALNSLEHAGWATVAANKLDIPAGQARMLYLLAVRNPGRVVPYHLMANVLTRRPRNERSDRDAIRVSTKVSQIRAALVDVGCKPAHLRCVPLEGYALSEDAVQVVRSIVEAACPAS